MASNHSAAAPAVSSTHPPVFAWFFGYVGASFYPQTELGLTPNNLISAAANMSAQIGRNNLRLVSPVNELPGHVIPPSMNSTIRSFVASLHNYSSIVYGRLDLLQFNMTTPTTIYQETYRYVNVFGLNGVWLDHAAIVYGNGGKTYFNNMMQNLTASFPSLNFILNQATFGKGHITPIRGTTWANMTYISPTVVVNTYDGIPFKEIVEWNNVFHGRVLLHFDAFANSKIEPMGIFADQNTSVEIAAIKHLANKGMYPRSSNYSFNLLYPIMGSWTYRYSLYNGTLYNSLTSGNYARGTFWSFLQIMSSIGSRSTADPVFVWLYGWVGDFFYPQTELGLSNTDLISVARDFSMQVGSNNLRLVAPVDEEPGHNIQPQMISTIKSYVDSLRQYSSVVYGRIDMREFNTTSTVKIYTEVAMYYNQLDLNGVWFDHAPLLYLSLGQSAYNSLIQNMTNSLPGIQYIMDQSANTGGKYITPLNGTTWGKATYISPTVASNSDTLLSFSKIATLNSIFPGHVLIHYDAFAPSAIIPMSYFSMQSSTNESIAVRYLAYTGEFPSQQQYAFTFLYPVIGSWTYLNGPYNGTLYNALTVGSYARGTIFNFTNTILATYHDRSP